MKLIRFPSFVNRSVNSYTLLHVYTHCSLFTNSVYSSKDKTSSSLFHTHVITIIELYLKHDKNPYIGKSCLELRGHLGVPDTVSGPLIVPLNYLVIVKRKWMLMVRITDSPNTFRWPSGGLKRIPSTWLQKLYAFTGIGIVHLRPPDVPLKGFFLVFYGSTLNLYTLKMTGSFNCSYSCHTAFCQSSARSTDFHKRDDFQNLTCLIWNLLYISL